MIDVWPNGQMLLYEEEELTKDLQNMDALSRFISEIPWESLISVREYPTYLYSLLNVVKRMIAENTYTGQLFAAFQAGMMRLKEFLSHWIPESLLSSAWDLLKSLGKVLLQAVQSIIEGVIRLFHKAMGYLAEFSASFVSSLSMLPVAGSNVLEMIHERSVETVIFSFLLVQDAISLGKEKLEEYAAELNKKTNRLTELVERISLSSVVNQVLQILLRLPGIKGLLEYLTGTTLYKKVVEILAFLSRILQSVVGTALSLVTRFAQGIQKTSAEIIMHLFSGEEEVVGNFFDLVEGCKKLSERNDITERQREKLKRSVKLGETFLGALKPQRLSNLRFLAGMGTKLYFGKSLSPQEEDQVYRLRTGFSSAELKESLSIFGSLMEMNFDDVIRQKEKIKIDGVIDDPAAGMDEAEKLQEISRLDVELGRLEKEIKRIEEENVAYQDAIANARNQNVEFLGRIDLSQDEIDVANDIYRKKLAAFEFMHGITRLKEQIAALEERRNVFQLSVSRWRRLMKPRIGRATVLVVLAVFGYMIYTTVKKWERDTAVATRIVFRPLLERAQFDPLLEAQIQRFAIERGIDVTAQGPELIGDLQRYMMEIPNAMLAGDIPYEEVQRTWAPLLEQSIAVRNHINAPEQTRTYWEWFTRPDKSLTNAPYSIASPDVGMESVALSIVAETSAVQIYRGPEAFDGIDLTEKRKSYVMAVAHVFKGHNSMMLSPLQAEYKEALEATRGVKHWSYTMFQYFYSGMEKTGTMGADTTMSFDKFMDTLAGGHAPLLLQQFLLYQGYLALGIAAARLVIILVNGLVGGTLYTLTGDRGLSSDFFGSIAPAMTRVLGNLGVEIVANASQIMVGRLFIPLLIVKFFWASMPTSWVVRVVKFPWVVAKGAGELGIKGAQGTWGIFSKMNQERRRRVIEEMEKEAQEKRYQLLLEKIKREREEKEKVAMHCALCVDSSSIWICGHCPEQTYCSESCAQLDWSHHYIASGKNGI